MMDKSFPVSEDNLPSVVAHSFGTYILGYSLLRYETLRFDKVILCGSILPEEFPWDDVLDRGQVTAVLNEFGNNDVWPNIARWFIAGAGASGLKGFWSRNVLLVQREFSFDHSEYFSRKHMIENWLEFINQTIATRPRKSFPVHRPRPNIPWGLYGIYLIVVATLASVFTPWGYLTSLPQLTTIRLQLNAATDRAKALQAELETARRASSQASGAASAPQLDELRSELSSRQAEFEQAKQQFTAAQQRINSLQADLQVQQENFNKEKQARMAAEQSSQTALLSLQLVQRLPDITTALNLMWPAREIVKQLQGSDDAILITTAPANADLGKYLVNLIEMTALDMWEKDNAIRRAILVQLPNYESDLDAPRFDTSNYPGISIHGEPKYIGEQAPFRNTILDLFRRMHSICNAEIGWTHKSLPQLFQFYKRNVIWIEIGLKATC